MKTTNTESLVLDDATCAFLQDDVFIYAASRDAANTPSMARAYGCRITPDRREVTIFLSTPTATALLNDLRNQQVIAVVVAQPRSHKSLQLKAKGPQIAALYPGDRELIGRYWKMMAEALRGVGYTDPFVGAVTQSLIPEFTAVTFIPENVFVQTPGPNAGRKLGT